jgi:hypothetical protein
LMNGQRKTILQPHPQRQWLAIIVGINFSNTTTLIVLI